MTITDAEVRAWCREQGIEVPARGKLNPSFHAQWREAHPDEPGDEQLVDDELGDEQLVDDAGDERPPALRLVAGEQPAAETPPRSPRPARFNLFQRAAAASRSRGPKRRVSLETVCARGWSLLAAAAAQTGRGPTARVLAMQAPVAGVILEESLKGTVADRILQPLARASQTGSKVGALLGPPVLVSLLDRKPELAPQVLPLLHLTLREWVMVAGPAMKAQEKRQAKAMEALGLDEGESLDAMIEGMIEAIFGGDEEPAGEHVAA